MFAGHFGVAAAVKARVPHVPLWALMVSTQLYDIVFIPLQALKVETIAGTGYGNALIQAFYSHSLIGALALALLAGWLAARRWGRTGGAVIAAVTCSHWLLDLLVHRPDLPLLPGNAGQLPLMGFGLWQYPTASLIVECSILAAGALLYFRYAWNTAGPHKRARGVAAGTAMAVFLAASLAVGFM